MEISRQDAVNNEVNEYWEMTAMQEFMVGIIKLYHGRQFTAILDKILSMLASIPEIVKTSVYHDFVTLKDELQHGSKYVVLSTQLGVINDDTEFGFFDPTMYTAKTNFLRSLHRELLGGKASIAKQKQYAKDYTKCRLEYKDAIE